MEGSIRCAEPDSNCCSLSGTGWKAVLQPYLLYYLGMIMPVLLLALVIGATSVQVIQIGPSDPEYCYKIEKLTPNLVLRGAVHLIGSIRDQTSAPLQNSPIELRKYISQRKQVNVRLVSTDDGGHFDLGIVKPGNYRLLASPHRGFKQQSSLQCRDGKNCELEIVLITNPTDKLDSSCPIR